MDEFSPQQRERVKLRPQKASHLTERLPIKKNYKNMVRTLHFPLFQGLVPSSTNPTETVTVKNNSASGPQDDTSSRDSNVEITAVSFPLSSSCQS